MVAIFTGAGTGFERGSSSVLGGAGLLGGSSLGRGGEQLFLNAATGNLVVSQRDEFLVGRGPDAVINRTYNSLGDLSDENGDNWRYGTDRRVVAWSGSHASGSTVQRVSGDGSVITYKWVSGTTYVATDGSGAHDTLTQSGSDWTWRDGDSQVTEVYQAYGTNSWRIVSQSDTEVGTAAERNTITFSYTGDKLTRITTADGGFVEYSWSGNTITQLTTGFDAGSDRAFADQVYRLYDAAFDRVPDPSGLDGNIRLLRSGGTPLQIAEAILNSAEFAARGTGSMTNEQYVQFLYTAALRRPADPGGLSHWSYMLNSGQMTRASLLLMFADTPEHVTAMAAIPGRTFNGTLILTRTRYSYDGYGRLATVAVDLSPGDSNAGDGKVFTTSYSYYGSSKLLSSVAGSDGSKIDIFYDGNNRVTRLEQLSSAGVVRTTVITYGAGVTSITDPLGQTVQLEYDVIDSVGNDGFLKKITMPANGGAAPQVTRFDYDTSGNLQTVTDALGSQTGFTYDGNGNVLTSTDRLGNIVARTYGSRNELLTETSTSSDAASAAAAHTTRYIYDAENHLRFRVSAEGLVSEYRYTVTGERSSEITYTDQAYGGGALDGSAGDLARCETWVSSLGFTPAIQRTDYTYDIRGNQLTQTSYSDLHVNRLAKSPLQSAEGWMIGYNPQGIANAGSPYAGTWNGKQFIKAELTATAANQVVSLATDYNTCFDVTGGERLAVRAGVEAQGSVGSLGITLHFWDLAGNYLGSRDLPGLAGNQVYDTQIAGFVDVPANAAQTRLELYGRTTGSGAGSFVLINPMVAQATPDQTVVPGFTTGVPGYSRAVATGAAAANLSRTVFTYDQAGQLLSRQVSGRNVERFAYDGLGRLVASVDVNGGTTSMVFDDTNTKTIVTMANGFVQTSTYNKAGELVAFAEASAGGSLAAAAGTATYGYDQNGRLRWSQDASGRKTYVVYDQTGRKTADVNALGDLVEYRYDANNRLVATISYATRLTSGQVSNLDNAGQPASIEGLRPGATASDVWSWNVYDREGRLLQAIANDGSTSVNSYDGAGRLIRVVAYANKLAAATLAGLKSAGPTAVNLPVADGAKDRVSRTFYDKDGRLLGTLDSEGFVTRIIYDKAGQKTEEVAFAKATTADRANGTLNQLVAGIAVSSQDRRNRFVYDGQGQLRYTIDSGGYLTQLDYDASGQVTRTTRYSAPVAFTYDLDSASWSNAEALSYIASQPDLMAAYGTDAEAGRQHYMWTGGPVEGRTITFDPHAYLASYPDLLKAYGFDAEAGARHYITNGRNEGRTVTAPNFSYAALKARVATGNLSGAAQGARTSWTVYDSAGRAAYAINAEGFVTGYLYNNLGQVTRVAEYGTARPTSALPDKAAMDSWASANAAAGVRYTRNYYDGTNALRYVVDPAGYVTYRETDNEGRVVQTIRWANAITIGDSATTDTVYSLINSNGGEAFQSFTSYDALGRVQTTTDAGGVVRRFEYDALGQLIRDIEAWGTADESVTAFVYDGAGRTSEIHRAFGQPEVAVTRYAYDGLGNLTAETDPRLAMTTFYTYDRAGNLRTKADVAGTQTFDYDGYGNVIKSVDARGNAAYSYYDQLNRLIASADAEGYVTETSYTGFGEVAAVTRRFNKATVWGSPFVLPAFVKSDKDATTSFEYDKLGRLTKTTDAMGFYEQYTLDAFGNRIRVRNKLGATIVNSYNARNLLTYETLPIESVRNDGSVQATSVTNVFDYDSRGNRIWMTEANGLAEQRTTSYSYDKLNRLVAKSSGAVDVLSQSDFRTVTSATPTETYTYDKRGNLIQTSDALGARTLAWYDDLDRKTWEISATGTLKRWTYDANGNVQAAYVYGDAVAVPAAPGGSPPAPANPNDFRATAYEYDALNRVIRTSVDSFYGSFVAAANGVETGFGTLSTRYSYDANGNTITVTDANGGVVTSYYDKNNRKSAQVDQEGYLTTWAYDAEGNVLTERRYASKWTGAVATSAPPAVPGHADDRITTFEYDRNGRRFAETRHNISAWNTNASNGTIAWVSSTSRVEYSYNGLGQVTSKKEATGDQVSYDYDNSGRLIRERRAAITNPWGYPVTPTVSYAYNGLNNLTRTAQSDKEVADRVTSYTYSAGGRLAALTDAAGGTHNYAYDAAGNLLRDSYTRVRSNGTSVTEAILYGRDVLGRLTSQAIATDNGSSWVRGDSQETEYNVFGEVSRRGINGLWQESFTYNHRGLVEKTNSGDGVWRFFVYDRNGNRTLSIESEGADIGGSSLPSVVASLGSYAGQNYVDGLNTTIERYDRRNQNTVVAQQHREVSYTGARQNFYVTRGYNAFGEVTWQTDPIGNQQGTQAAVEARTAYFTYDAMGRLIKKELPVVSTTNENGVTTQARPTELYYYDQSGRLIATRDANGAWTSQTLLAGTGYGGSAALTTAEFHSDGGVARTYYDGFGDARLIRNELGQDEWRAYDGMGRLTTQVKRGGLTEYYSYDLLGQRTRHWNSFFGAGVFETTDYDLQGRVVSQVAFGGDAITTSYAWNGGLYTTGMTTFGGWNKVDTYANGRTLSVWTDTFGRDVSKVDLGGHVTNYGYDLAGRQVFRSSDGMATNWLNSGLVGETYIYTGDAANSTRVSTRNSYDANGNLLSSIYDRTVHESGYYWVNDGPTNPYYYEQPYIGSEGHYEYYDNTYTSVLQNQSATYDALNRLISWNEAGSGSPAASKQIQYDLNGNIRRSVGTFWSLNAQGGGAYQTTQDLWFRYDTMNRVVISDGTLLNGQVVANGGEAITYNVAGQRTSVARVTTATAEARYNVYTDYDPYGGYYQYYDVNYYTYDQVTREDYGYDAAGNLNSVRVASNGYHDNGDGTVTFYNAPATGVLQASFYYDSLNRLSAQYDWLGDGTNAGYQRSVTYNNKSQITSETTITKRGSDTYQDTTTNDFSYGGYALGAVTQSWVKSYKNGSDSNAPDTTTQTTYAWYDGAVVSSVSFRPDNSKSTWYTSSYTLSPTGILTRVQINDGRPRSVTYTNDMSGQVIRRDEADNNYSNGDPHEIWYRFNGREMTYSGNNGTLNSDYASSASQRRVTAGTGAFRGGSTYSWAYGDSDSSFEATTSFRQGAAGGSYKVRAGDTLQGIAQNVWGDSSLWYKIAEANGLTADAALLDGQQLTLPAGITRSKNNANTFKPYDAAETIGDLSPTTPKPPKQKKGCGGLGMVLLAVVAIAVTIVVTAGATAAISGQAFGSVLGAMTGGAAVSGVSAGAWIAGGAIGGAIGSAASQGLGVATGLQEKFSWKGVALAGLSGAISGGLSAVGNTAQNSINTALQAGKSIQQATAQLSTLQRFLTSGGVLATGARSAATSALTQGIGVVTGLQNKFDWVGVVAAGVGASVGRAIGANALSANTRGFGQQIFVNMASGVANAATRSLVTGSSFGDNVLAALPDIIGQTIGNSIVDELAQSFAPVSLADRYREFEKDLIPASQKTATLSPADQASANFKAGQSKPAGYSEKEAGYAYLSADDLAKALKIDRKLAATVVPYLNDAMFEAGFKTPASQAAFIAQVAKETGKFQTYNEDGSYSLAVAKAKFSAAADPANAKALAAIFAPENLHRARSGAMVLNSGKPQEDFFNLIYGTKNGNKGAGDGYLYRGRGAIQVTGRSNYKEAGDLIGVDLIKNPGLINDFKYTFRASAAFFFTKTALNRGSLSALNLGQVNKVSSIVNKWDTASFAQREAYYTAVLPYTQSTWARANPKKMT